MKLLILLPLGYSILIFSFAAECWKDFANPKYSGQKLMNFCSVWILSCVGILALVGAIVGAINLPWGFTL